MEQALDMELVFRLALDMVPVQGIVLALVQDMVLELGILYSMAQVDRLDTVLELGIEQVRALGTDDRQGMVQGLDILPVPALDGRLGTELELGI